MHSIQPKKLLIINILDILKRYTDENHRLSQKEIIEILKNAYQTVVDCISDIECLDTPVKPPKQVRGLDNGLDLPKHMAEHIYMFAVSSERVSFRAQKYIVGEIIDWFGKDVLFSKDTDEEVTATVTVNLHAMRYWPMQYAPHIRVLSPESLVEQIKTDLKIATDKYALSEEEK